MTRIVVAGDALLDRDWTGRPTVLCPDSWAPVIDLDGEHVRPGGAALTALAVAAQGADTALVAGLGRDPAGEQLAALLRAAGVELIDLGLDGRTPEKIRVRSGTGTVVRLDRGCTERPAAGRWTHRADAAVGSADAVLLSDYGRGLVHRPELAAALGGDDAPVVWDPHRSSHRPAARVDLATPSLAEAQALVEDDADPRRLAAVAARRWATSVAITVGRDGVVVADTSGATSQVRSDPVDGDPCGAGDFFAAGATVGLATGASVMDAAAAGCASARRWIAEGAAMAPPTRPRVIATSGCFDVLHVGHLELLRHARSLGDRLVVLLNSDASVRRLKGHGRPVNTQHDRRTLLAALEEVDDVVVFDELTPCQALEALRPDVFVKGADYEGVDIPEVAVMAQWGGTVDFAPLVPGRSTTRTLELVARLTG